MKEGQFATLCCLIVVVFFKSSRSSCTNTGIFLVVRLLSTVKGADWTIASDIRGAAIDPIYTPPSRLPSNRTSLEVAK